MELKFNIEGFAVWMIRNDSETAILLGVFTTEALAEKAIGQYKNIDSSYGCDYVCKICPTIINNLCLLPTKASVVVNNTTEITRLGDVEEAKRVVLRLHSVNIPAKVETVLD